MVQIKKSKYIQIILVALFSVFLVFMGSKFSRSIVNTNNDYSVFYQERMEKGFLSEQDIAQLNNLEKKYLENNESRNERLRGYFGVLTIFMLAMSVFMFVGKYKKIVCLNSLTISALVLLIAVFITGSVAQSISWSIFALAGSLVADFFTSQKTSLDKNR